jgi:hypothetical protein
VTNPITEFDTQALLIYPSMFWATLTVTSCLVCMVSSLIRMSQSSRYQINHGDSLYWRASVLIGRIGLGIFSFGIMLSLFQQITVFPDSSPREAIIYFGISIFMSRSAIIDAMRLSNRDRQFRSYERYERVEVDTSNGYKIDNC